MRTYRDSMPNIYADEPVKQNLLQAILSKKSTLMQDQALAKRSNDIERIKSVNFDLETPLIKSYNQLQPPNPSEHKYNRNF